MQVNAAIESAMPLPSAVTATPHREELSFVLRLCRELGFCFEELGTGAA